MENHHPEISLPDLHSSHFQKIETCLGYSFQNRAFLQHACIHRSFANEHPGIAFHNERLEFLGDAILGYVVAELLYLEHPEVAEGDLSSMRSRLVEASACTTYLRHLGLESYLLLGKGEQSNAGKGRESVLADFLEALIGAIYLDGGMEVTRSFLLKRLREPMEEILHSPVRNWKAELQDWMQKIYRITPSYRILEEMGPEHHKKFCVGVFQNELLLGKGEGFSKKEAQQAAAKEALEKAGKE